VNKVMPNSFALLYSSAYTSILIDEVHSSKIANKGLW